MKKILIVLLFTLMAVPMMGATDEGMWLLSLIKKNNEAAMNALGLQISVEEIIGDPEASLSQAVVSFGGGCTASFISKDGLLLTNYHCSYGAIQQHSSMENNIPERGFWALSRTEELPVSGLTIIMNKNIIDVSEQMNTILNARGRSNENLRSAAETVSKKHAVQGVRNIVKSYRNGLVHILYQQQVFEDVRLVGVPPKSVAKFGGETDNWMWPRHSVDFAYFRVYVSPDGKPAKYSRNNVPYHPAEYLKVSTDGYSEGDFAMSMGYPGHTDRQATSARVWEVQNIYNVPMIDARRMRMDILKKRMDADPAIRLKYSEKYSTAANYLKNAQGMNEWIEKLGVVGNKQAFEHDLIEWINSEPGRAKRYPEVESYLLSLRYDNPELDKSLRYFREGFGENSEMLRFAGAFGGWMYAAIYNPKGGAGKLSDFVNTARNHYKEYVKEIDVEVTKAIFRMIREKVAEELMPSFYAVIDTEYNGDTDAYVDMLYEKSLFADIDKIVAWTEKPYSDYNSDPVVIVLNSIKEKEEEINRTRQQSPQNDLRQGAVQYQAALTEYKADAFYPNADGTLRLSYGTVQPLEADGARHNYQTFLSELIAKEDSANSDYYVHSRLKDIWESKDFARYGTDNDMPLCFITDGDVTGGNSGSPMLNAHGEVIGIVFDCNWESMTRDYNYNPGMNRVICVDIRYVLLVTEKFSGANIFTSEILGR